MARSPSTLRGQGSCIKQGSASKRSPFIAKKCNNKIQNPKVFANSITSCTLFVPKFSSCEPSDMFFPIRSKRCMRDQLFKLQPSIDSCREQRHRETWTYQLPVNIDRTFYLDPSVKWKGHHSSCQELTSTTPVRHFLTD